MKSPLVSLSIGGAEWEGWKEVSITRQMDAIAGNFSLGLADKWKENMKPLPLAAGLSCQVLCDGEALITGFIDSKQNSRSDSDHTLTVAGRDNSADLVDCSSAIKPGHWLNQDALSLCQAICAPFGISVSANVDVGAPFPVYRQETGESSFEAMDRLLKQRELLLMPDGKGNLVLEKVGSQSSSSALVEGENILTWTEAVDWSQRFSDYIVYAQQQGSDTVSGSAASGIRAQAQDTGPGRYRPLIIRAENQMDAATSQKRAAWEATVRKARSYTLTLTCFGWRDGSGSLFRPNTLIPVSIPSLGLDDELLIAAVTLTKNASGSISSLTLRDKGAFLPEIVTVSKKGSGGSGSSGNKWFEISEAQKDSAETSNKNLVGAK